VFLSFHSSALSRSRCVQKRIGCRQAVAYQRDGGIYNAIASGNFAASTEAVAADTRIPEAGHLFAFRSKQDE
jgi:hypothetical protein